ncbi:MAG: prkC 14, partial [Gemmataceae bacterium]|nr:prkC 14 [Gemmataceae bacterium]
MASPSELHLSDAERALLSIRADQFHDALTRGAVADWTRFLDGLAGTVRVAVLTELAVIDLGHRWERGERPTAKDYLARFPELGPPDRPPPALVREEERYRMKAGETIVAAPDPGAATDSVTTPGAEADGSPTRTVRAAGPPPALAGGWGGEGVVSIPQEYELVRELGRGAFGEVWLARKMPSGIEKAVKVLHQPADQDAAQREFRALELIKNLRHPYLLATEDFWVAHNRLYIVTELADYTLRGRLKECKIAGLPGILEDELLGYMREAAEGLDFLHAKMITHRDVKPDNILVLNGHAKVADFGLARRYGEQMAAMSFAGTPAYMAPEVWSCEGGPPSDLYGFAVGYVELRQGAVPFRGERVPEVMKAHLGGQFEFADFIPEAERAVLRRAMAREPEDRHPSCLAFVEELAGAMGLSIVRGSGRVPMPAARPAPAVPSDPVSPSTDPAGLAVTALKSTLVKHRLAAEPVPSPPPPEPPPRPRGRFLSIPVLVGVTVAILGAVGVVVWAVIGIGGGPQVATGPTPTAPTGTEPTRNQQEVEKSGDNGKGKGEVVRPVVRPEIVVPPGTTPDPSATVVTLADSRRVPEWVVAERGGHSVRFRLLAPAGGAGTTRPFYIAESKVWNRLYADAGRTAGMKPPARNEPGGPDAPAVNTTAKEAAAFAAAVFEGGRL